MKEASITLVDLRPMRRRLEVDGRFEPAVYESWFSLLYCRAHSVPCISASLLDFIPNDFSTERVRLVTTAQSLGIDPIQHLPLPRDLSRDLRGLTFLLDNDILMIGTGSVIEKAWRNLSCRFP